MEIRFLSVPKVLENVTIRFSELKEDIATRGSVALLFREYLLDVTRV
jgi:hypothetical protein